MHACAFAHTQHTIDIESDKQCGLLFRCDYVENINNYSMPYELAIRNRIKSLSRKNVINGAHRMYMDMSLNNVYSFSLLRRTDFLF